jgi:hypothetical protein
MLGLNEVKVVTERVLYSYGNSPTKFHALESPSLPSVPFLAEQINQKWQQLIGYMTTFNHPQVIYKHDSFVFLKKTHFSLLRYVQLITQIKCQLPQLEDITEEKCTLCLNPLTKNDKKLLWCEKIYHSACANFWCNRIKPTAPV